MHLSIFVGQLELVWFSQAPQLLFTLFYICVRTPPHEAEIYLIYLKFSKKRTTDLLSCTR